MQTTLEAGIDLHSTLRRPTNKRSKDAPHQQKARSNRWLPITPSPDSQK